MNNNSVRIRISSVTIYSVLLAFLLITVFLLPSSLKSISSVVFAALLFIMLLIQKPKSLLLTRFPTGLVVSLLVVAFAVILSFAFSPWPKGTVLTVALFLLLSAFLFGGGLELPSDSMLFERVFYIVILAVVVYSVVSGIGKPSAMYIQDAYDKNYFGIILFLFFAWCWSTKRKIGVLVCVASALILGSRNYAIMILLFFAFTFLEYRHLRRAAIRTNSEYEKEKRGLYPSAIVFIFTIMLVVITVFSFWWSDSVVGSSTTAYKEGFNDSSNAIRFNSDKYALEYLFAHPELFGYGYDSEIIEAMGIIDASELNGTETALTGTFYNGYRIVQPHHVILNMLLKEGVLFTAAYYIALSYIFSRHLRRSNAAIWVPYFFGCMFMHSLLVNYYLVFLLLVLVRSNSMRPVLPPQEGRRNAIGNHGSAGFEHTVGRANA